MEDGWGLAPAVEPHPGVETRRGRWTTPSRWGRSTRRRAPPPPHNPLRAPVTPCLAAIGRPTAPRRPDSRTARRARSGTGTPSVARASTATTDRGDHYLENCCLLNRRVTPAFVRVTPAFVIVFGYSEPSSFYVMLLDDLRLRPLEDDRHLRAGGDGSQEQPLPYVDGYRFFAHHHLD